MGNSDRFAKTACPAIRSASAPVVWASKAFSCNQFYLDQIGVSSLSQVVGKDDYAFGPAYGVAALARPIFPPARETLLQNRQAKFY